MTEQKKSNSNFTATLKSGKKINAEFVYEEDTINRDENNAFKILNCTLKKSLLNLNSNIQHIQFTQEISNLEKIIMIFNSNDSSDILWKQTNQEYIYVIKNIKHQNFVEFVKRSIICGFDCSEAVPPNIIKDGGGVMFVHLTYLRNVEGMDLLMHALQNKLTYLFDILLEYDFDLERRDKMDNIVKNYAVTMLEDCKDEEERSLYLKVIEHLTCANSPYYRDISIYEYSTKVNNIMEISKQLRKGIKKNDTVSVIKTIEENPNLRCFYDESNQSFLCFLIKINSIHLNMLCDKFDLKIGVHEEPELYKYLNNNQQEITNIAKYILLNKFRYMSGEHFQKNHRTLAKESLNVLFQNSICSSYLRLCAANRSSVIFNDFIEEFYDLNTKTRINGFTDTHGNMFIAAKNLTNNKKSQAIGVMAHEFGHQAMQLTYWNRFNPIALGGTSIHYEKIFNNIKNAEMNEQIVQNVFKDYNEIEQRSELIVTLAQMIIQDPSRKDEIVKMYPELFSFIKETILKDMKEAIPVLAKLQNEKENISYECLTPAMKARLFYSSVSYEGKEITYFNLFGKYEAYFKKMPSSILKTIFLNDKILNISSADYIKIKNKKRKLQDLFRN